MSLKIGIIGLPNVGKSTLFQALTQKKVDIANYPFCTIEPNVGITEVPDKILYQIAQITKTPKAIPSVIEFVDIAGLVKGAHKGEGLGNQFLSHIREVDAICHVVRAFTDENVSHEHGSADPKKDVEIINLELVFADLGVLERREQKLKEQAKAGMKPDLKKEIEVVEKLICGLKEGKMVSQLNLGEKEKSLVKGMSLLTFKPRLIILNIGDEAKTNLFHNFAAHCLAINLASEKELSELDKKELEEYLKILGKQEKEIFSLISECFKLLNLINFYTFNKQEARAWSVVQGTRAPQAAGNVHTDMEKGFISADVCRADDFINLRGEEAVRKAGKMRKEGKDYIIQENDICYFYFSV